MNVVNRPHAALVSPTPMNCIDRFVAAVRRAFSTIAWLAHSQRDMCIFAFDVSLRAFSPFARTMLRVPGAIIAACAISAAAQAAQGGSVTSHFDTGFGVNGRAAAGAGPTREAVGSVALLPDGKQLLIGSCNHALFCAIKLNADGSVDTGFNETGRLILGPGRDAKGLVQPDGKIVMASSYCGGDRVNCMIRRNADGSVDATFNGTGQASFGSVPAMSALSALLLQQDGKILSVGQCGQSLGLCTFRHSSDGTLDTTYGQGGAFQAPATHPLGSPVGAALLPDGRLLVHAYCSPQTCVARVGVNGELDTTFGNGRIVTPLKWVHSNSGGVALQADGKIVLAGACGGSENACVTRLHEDGTLDDGFGVNGILRSVWYNTNPYVAEFTGVKVQSDGRIVVWALCYFDQASIYNQGPCALRTLADGSWDATFGAGGVVNTGLISEGNFGIDGALHADGRIYVWGLCTPGGDSYFTDFCLARLLATGSADTGYQQAGRVQPKVLRAGGYANSIVLRADGKILVGGNCSAEASRMTSTASQDFFDSCFARFTPTGTLDKSFQTVGTLQIDLGIEYTPTEVAEQSDGKIVFSTSCYPTYSDQTWCLGRMLADGTMDTSFGANGKAAIPAERAGFYSLLQIAIQSDGKIVLAARCGEGSNVALCLMRLHANGEVDTNFNGTGRVKTMLGLATGASQGYGRGMVLLPDGKLVLAAECGTSGGESLCLLRYLPDGTLDAAFGASGKALSFTTSRVMATGLVLQSDGKWVASGVCAGQGCLARYLPNGELDAAFNATGYALSSQEFLISLALQSDGKILTGGRCEGVSCLLRWNVDGSRDMTFEGTGVRLLDVFPQALRFQPDGKLLVAGPATGLDGLAVARLLSPVNEPTFEAQNDVPLITVRVSNTIFPGALIEPELISIAGGEYSIGCTAIFTSAAGTIQPGQSVCVRHTSSALPLTSVTTTLTIGGQAFAFTSTTANIMRLTVMKAGTGQGAVTSVPAGIDCGADCENDFPPRTGVQLTALPSAGSLFHSWSPASGACGSGVGCGFTMDGPVQLTARFEPVVTLTISRGGTGTGNVRSYLDGIDCGLSCAKELPQFRTVRLSAYADPDSAFAGWEGVDCVSYQDCAVEMTQSRRVFAKFERAFELQISKEGAGAANGVVIGTGQFGVLHCGATCSARFPRGDTVTLKAEAPVGTTFIGWSGPCAGTGICTVTMNQTQGVIAVFVAGVSATLSVSKSGSGAGTILSDDAAINCGAACSVTKIVGDTVTLRAWPQVGSAFTGWSGACTGLGNCELHLQGDTTVSASFMPAGPRAVRSDLNGDGRSDVLWHNVATGMLFGMPANGLALGAGALLDHEPNPDWKVAALGDLNRDGHIDIVWRNAMSGDVYVLLIHGLQVVGEGLAYSEPNTQWRIVGTGDFDGDGRDELVWHHAADGRLYLLNLNGVNTETGSVIYIEPNLNWKVEHVADFNGDGKADVLWRNTVTGDVFVLLMNGTTVTGGGVIYSEPNTAWQIQAAADFNGDGRADILWRNTTTGDVFMMLMNGTTITGGSVFYGEPNADWKIVATGEYNGDGRADILWRNTATGQVFMMLMDGFTISGGGFVYTEPNQNWKILGP
jgi:uncharacterized delta-60 repeat protein